MKAREFLIFFPVVKSNISSNSFKYFTLNPLNCTAANDEVICDLKQTFLKKKFSLRSSGNI